MMLFRVGIHATNNTLRVNTTSIANTVVSGEEHQE